MAGKIIVSCILVLLGSYLLFLLGRKILKKLEHRWELNNLGPPESREEYIAKYIDCKRDDK